MVSDPSEDTPRRSRLLTILGGVQIALGTYMPTSIVLPLPSSWDIMEQYKLTSSALYYWSIGETLVLGALSVLAGILLIPRRSLAPLIAALSATAVLIDATYSLYLWGESSVRLIAMIAGESKYLKMTASYAGLLMVEGLRAVCSLATLGLLGRRPIQDEFPISRPELTTRSLWAWIALSALVAGLTKACLWVLGWLSEK